MATSGKTVPPPKKAHTKTSEGINKPAIRRLSYRGGVWHISGKVVEATRMILDAFLQKAVTDTVVYTMHAHRTTVHASDVLSALQNQGCNVYGYGSLGRGNGNVNHVH